MAVKLPTSSGNAVEPVMLDPKQAARDRIERLHKVNNALVSTAKELIAEARKTVERANKLVASNAAVRDAARKERT